MRFIRYAKWQVVASVAIALAIGMIFSCAAPERWELRHPAIKGKDYVGAQTCTMCHQQIVEEFENTDHGQIRVVGDIHRVGNPGCEACHGPGSLHLESGGKKKYIINPADSPSACFRCHQRPAMRFRLQSHHPVTEKRMSCMDCHDPHGQDVYVPANAKIQPGNDVCGQCHSDKTRPQVFEHEALRDGCTICHDPHGTINEKLLIERDNNLCLKCHAQIGVSGTMEIGDFDHTSRLSEGTCWSAGCHTAVHGSDINAHLRY